MSYAYDKSKIFDVSDKGLDIILSYFPKASEVVGTNRHFKVRDGDKTASANLWYSKKQDVWCIKDWGDSGTLNPIDLTMKLDGIDFSEACQKLALHYNIADYTPPNHKPTVEFSTAPTTATVTDYKIIYADEIPEKALKTVGVKVTQSDCDKYNFKYIEEVVTYFVHKSTGVLTQLTKKPTENYPIYGFDNGSWHKTYEPFASKEDKAPRFRFFGKKPTRFIFGLDLVEQRVLDKRNNNDDEKKKDEDIKLDNIIVVSGGSDGLNVASLNSDNTVIWFNSESEQLTWKEYQELKKDAKNICYLPDIDEAGIKQAVKLGNKFLDIKHIWLPEKLRLLKDDRGNFCKDAKDYITKYYRKNEPEQINTQFNNLVKSALPFQFWDSYKVKDTWKYKFNSAHAFHYLKHQGFYKIDDLIAKDGFSFVKITDNIVKKVTHVEMKDYINKFLLQTNKPTDLRNLIFDTTKLSEKQLSQLEPIELDFKDATKDSQYMFFENCSWKITPNEIIKIDTSDTKKMVWEDKILEHSVKIQEPHFKINVLPKENTKDPVKCTIDVLKTDNKFFNYMINTSRVHWRDDLEKPFQDDLEAKNKYFKANQFNIKGANLPTEQQQEQQQHLVNKIYAFGYFLHRHKSKDNSYFCFGMDNRISEVEDSNGGSGKSIMWNDAVQKVYKTVKYLEGRKKEVLEDKHNLADVSKKTDAIIIDDAGFFFKLDMFYSGVTGSMTIRPLFKSSFELPFIDSPKIAATSNFQLKDLSGSTMRRLLFTVFSDYYHYNTNGEYLEHRKVSDDFDGLLFDDFTKEDWNDFYNFVAQCIQFYLGQKEKIEPPMENVVKRNLLRVAGENFSDWADNYFNVLSDKLNTYTSRPYMYNDYKEFIGKYPINANKFRKSLKAWCDLKEHKFNPIEKIAINSEGKQRKNMTIDNKTQEVFYIEVNFTEEQIKARELHFKNNNINTSTVGLGF